MPLVFCPLLPAILRPPTSPLFPYTTLFRSLAFRLVADNAARLSDPRLIARVVADVADAAGTDGMVGGQVIDIESEDRKSTRLNSSHLGISYAVFCLKKKKNKTVTSSRVRRP